MVFKIYLCFLSSLDCFANFTIAGIGTNRKGVYYSTMVNEFQAEAKSETKSDTEEGLESAGDKIKAGAKPAADKIKDPNRDLGTEY